MQGFESGVTYHVKMGGSHKGCPVPLLRHLGKYIKTMDAETIGGVVKFTVIPVKTGIQLPPNHETTFEMPNCGFRLPPE